MASRRERIPEPAPTERPVLAVSLGDPGGIGPEVLARALADDRAFPGARFRVFGSASVLHAACEAVGVEPFWWRVRAGSDLIQTAAERRVVLIDTDGDAAPRPERGPTREGGALSFAWVEAAIAAAKLPAGSPGAADGIVTGPISKKAWDLAGRGRWPGHTELLASRFNAKRHLMFFEGPDLRVALATIHVPLMDVRNVLTIGAVYDAIDLGEHACRMLGVPRPRIAVCGLNPHAGEGGLLGDEETRIIEPAVQIAAGQGIRVSGPYPGDAIFDRAVGGEFDLVVAMYHDQGLIPVKLLARERSVNVTVGLPVVRTSPDHGTAFDIAGRGVADAGSTIAAIETALRMLRPRAAAPAGRGADTSG